jgi:hypothetical protein
MRREPAAHHRLGDRRAVGAAARRREVAQPGEAVEIIGEGGRDMQIREIAFAERQLEPAMEEMAGADRGARARVAPAPDRRARRAA